MTLNGTTGLRSEAGERRPDKTRCYRFNAQTPTGRGKAAAAAALP